MKKKILNVALLSVIACGAPATFTSCDDDGWKDRTNVLDEEMAENSKLIEQLTSQTKALETQIAQYKQEGDAAAKAADAAKAAADAAQKTGDDAMAAAKAADAAAQLAAKAAADAKAEAADALKKQYDELIALIKANAKEIESNSGKINDNANAIAKILETIDGSSKTFKDLQGTVAGLQVAIEALNGKAESLGLDVANLKKTMDEELGKLEANLLAEIKKNNETDAALQSEINAIKAELEKLGIATNLAEFTKFIGDANTQFDALKKYDEELTTKLADLASKVSAADALIKANQDSIASQKKALDEVSTLAAKNATAILENTNKIAANAKDIEALKGEVTNVKNSIDSVNAQVKAIDAKIDSISKNIMGVQANLVTFVMEQLRGLVFVPETFVDGMECALAYNMSYYKMKQGEKGTGNTTLASFGDFSGYINTADYNRFNYIAVDDESSKADKDKFGDNDAPQTWVSYNMNPATATVKQEDLHIISHNATVISRASKAGLEIEGMELADGVLKVAIKGNAKESKMSSGVGEVPVFAIQADVYYDTVGEDGETVKNKTVVTSDYAIFQTMFVKNPKFVVESSDTEVELKGKKNLNELVAIQYNNNANNGDEQWENGAWSKFVKVEFEAVKYATSAPTDGGVIKNSPSDYVTINGNMLTVNTDNPQAINAEPLIRAAMYDLKGNLIGQEFFTIKITNNVKNIPVAKIAFKNMDFSYCGDCVNEMPEGVNLYKAVLEASGLGEAEFRDTYKAAKDADDQMTQYVLENDGYVKTTNNVGKVQLEQLSSYTAPYSLKWTFTQEQQQQLYTKKNRATETYVCFESSESKYAPIYVPLSIAMNNKTQLTISGGKYAAYWSGANNDVVTIHANGTATGFANLLGFDLCSLWTGKVPSFVDQNGKAFALTNGNATTTAVKYYFPNNAGEDYKKFETSYEDLKYVLEVKYGDSQKNEALFGGSDNYNNKMGDNALIVDDNALNREYQTTELKAKLTRTYGNTSTSYEFVIAKIKSSSEHSSVDYLTFAMDNVEAKRALNLFGDQFKVLVAMVPYHSESNHEKIAYALTNPTFEADFLRPVTINPINGLEFTTGNGSINIFDMLAFEDWQGTNFSAKPWLYGRYNVRNVEVDTDHIMTDAADGSTFRTDDNVVFTYVLGHNAVEKNSKYEAGSTEVDVVDYEETEVSEANGAKLQAQAKFGLGSLKLTERGAITKAFNAVVPVKVIYQFGEYTVYVKCKVAAVSAN